MRVLQVVPNISQQTGGPSIALPGLARCLVDHGVDTTLMTTVASDADPGAPLGEPVTGDRMTYVVHRTTALGGRYGLSPAMWRTLRRTVATYDIVHIHWLYGFSSIAAANAARAAGVPFVVQANGSLDPHLLRKNRLVKRTYLATIGRPLLASAAAVIFTSQQEQALASYAPRRQEWIVPVGLDDSTFTPLPARGTFRSAFPAVDGPFLLFLGRLSRQKALDLLIRALATLTDDGRDIRLVLAGPDPDGYGAYLQTLCTRLGVQDRVLFAGLLTHDMKLAAYVDAELFVLPSYAENFGAVTTEALACGLPVVMSDQVNIHREMATAGVARVVQCSADSVASGIASALDDTAWRRRAATLGPLLVREHYTWNAIVPALVKRYSGAITRAVA